MLNPKNSINLTCGIVMDPEIINDNILKLRVAVDFAGSEKDSDNTSGYFDVTYFMNNDDNIRNAKFVREQISKGTMKKGSQVQLLGRLQQDRWSADGGSRSKVLIVAEAITFAGGAPRTEGSAPAQPSVAASTAVPDSF